MGEKKPGNQIKKNGHEISSKPGIDDEFVSGIRELILAARAVSKRSIDKIQVITCFEIGARIVEREQKGKARAQYGKQNTKFSNFLLFFIKGKT